MKQIPILFVFAFLSVQAARAQLYLTKNGHVSFHSHTFLEDINAVNDRVMAVIDLGKKKIAFSMQMKEFSFKKKLMQEHFNENYVESDKYPKATFNGGFAENVTLAKDGSHPITVTGSLTMHGVTRNITVPAILLIKQNVLTGTCTFKLNPADFNIDIPMLVRNKIEKENTVNIKVDWTIKN